MVISLRLMCYLSPSLLMLPQFFYAMERPVVANADAGTRTGAHEALVACYKNVQLIERQLLLLRLMRQMRTDPEYKMIQERVRNMDGFYGESFLERATCKTEACLKEEQEEQIKDLLRVRERVLSRVRNKDVPRARDFILAPAQNPLRIPSGRRAVFQPSSHQRVIVSATCPGRMSGVRDGLSNIPLIRIGLASQYGNMRLIERQLALLGRMRSDMIRRNMPTDPGHNFMKYAIQKRARSVDEWLLGCVTCETEAGLKMTHEKLIKGRLEECDRIFARIQSRDRLRERELAAARKQNASKKVLKRIRFFQPSSHQRVVVLATAPDRTSGMAAGAFGAMPVRVVLPPHVWELGRMLAPTLVPTLTSARALVHAPTLAGAPTLIRVPTSAGARTLTRVPTLRRMPVISLASLACEEGMTMDGDDDDDEDDDMPS